MRYSNYICHKAIKSDSWESGKKSQVFGELKFLELHLRICNLREFVIFFDHRFSEMSFSEDYLNSPFDEYLETREHD